MYYALYLRGINTFLIYRKHNFFLTLVGESQVKRWNVADERGEREKKEKTWLVLKKKMLQLIYDAI